MREDDAFLRAILEEPDDDAPRLIYADWLEERGDPLSDLLRFQCGLAALPEADPRRLEFLARAGAVLVKHWRDWDRRFHTLIDRGKFRRGAPGSITLSGQTFLDHELVLSLLVPFPKLLVDLAGITVPPNVVEMLPESVARENVIFPLAYRDDVFLIALSDPGDIDLLQKLQFIMNRGIEPVPAERQQIVEAINRHYGQTETESVECILHEFVDGEFDYPQSFEREASSPPVVHLIYLMIQEAVHLQATEIRIEPLADCGRVRYRINGTLVERDNPPLQIIPLIVARLRMMSSIDNRLRSRSRRGHISMNLNGERIDLGVRMLSTIRGEGVVLQIRPPARRA
jgi:uncharacterized protein (TIGR02996 family)